MIDYFQLQRRVFPSPIGEIALGTEDHDLVGVCFVGQNHFPGNRPTNRPESVHKRLPVSRPTHSEPAKQWLANTAKRPAQFFVVMLQAFSVPVAICSGTPFQQLVWTELFTIAQGIKRSCVELAVALSKLKTSRPIEPVVGRNPDGVIVPAHQMPGSFGQLTGNVSDREGKRALATWGSRS
jgi:O6-methylguanine-DNA--protein-cysteine methyltransferase